MVKTARLSGVMPIAGTLLAAAALAFVAGCSNGVPSPTVMALCADDPAAFAAGQIAAALVPAPGVSTVEAIDAGIVHPAIQAACASVGKQAVGVSAGSPAAASPVSSAPAAPSK